jgi:hypothetical protein
MALWTSEPRPTIADDTESLAHCPSGGPLKMWLAGMGVAGALAAYGIACIVSEEATMLARHSRNMHVTGPAAVWIGAAWIALAGFIHFHYFWGLHSRLWRFSETLKVASLVVFLPCFFYGVALALNLASWLQ